MQGVPRNDDTNLTIGRIQVDADDLKTLYGPVAMKISIKFFSNFDLNCESCIKRLKWLKLESVLKMIVKLKHTRM